MFQICTLNQSASNVKKRQEIGRGVRLAVDQSGKSLDELSVEERAAMIEEYGEGIVPPPPRRAGEAKARLRKERALSEEFRALWDRIKQKTRYRVRIDSNDLVDEVVEELNRAVIEPPRIMVTKSIVSVTAENSFEAMQTSGARSLMDLSGRYPLPNLVEIMANLMEHTSPPVKLTRRTLLDVYRRSCPKLQQSGMDNPHEFAATAVRIIKEKLADHLVDGIEYERIADEYEMKQLLNDEEVELFTKFIVDVASNRALYDRVGCDSKVEEEFVRALEVRDDVRVYIKLPRWFTVPTPVGEYNPDWAIVIQPEEEGKPVLYFVAETKGSLPGDDLRPNELRKIKCGAAHFGSRQGGIVREGALDGIEYRVVRSAAEL